MEELRGGQSLKRVRSPGDEGDRAQGEHQEAYNLDEVLIQDGEEADDEDSPDTISDEEHPPHQEEPDPNDRPGRRRPEPDLSIPPDRKEYLDQVLAEDPDCPGMFYTFVHLLGQYRQRSVNVANLMVEVATLFYKKPQLVDGFNTYLPNGCSMVVDCNTNSPGSSHCIRCIAPQLITTVHSADRVEFSIPGEAAPGSAAPHQTH